MLPLTWLPITISFVGLILTLSAFLWQIHRARFNQSIDLLFRLEADFFGVSKQRQRARASLGMLNGNFVETEPILDFFETIALLVRRGALDQEIVWHTFFYWIDRYYEGSKDLIALRQRQDPLVWKDLTTFVLKLRDFQQSQMTASTYSPPSAEEIARFLAEEQTEIGT